jgi:hypothetical protein
MVGHGAVQILHFPQRKGENNYFLERVRLSIMGPFMHFSAYPIVRSKAHAGSAASLKEVEIFVLYRYVDDRIRSILFL